MVGAVDFERIVTRDDSFPICTLGMALVGLALVGAAERLPGLGTGKAMHLRDRLKVKGQQRSRVIFTEARPAADSTNLMSSASG